VEQGPADGWYLNTEHWCVGPHLTSAVPGWVVAYARRHAARLVDLRPDELEAMGPTLAVAARAIEQVLQPERVYSVMFGENIQHVHVVLIPRGPYVPPAHRSSALHVNQAHYADATEAARVSVQIRGALTLMQRG
jgi:diadenosine tetraphosphate (Ap4A) HIT family hydrolase